MSNKKPIDSLERFYHEFDSEIELPNICSFNSKRLKKLLKDGYYVDILSELWYDSEEGLSYNVWIDEYSDGVWWLSQEDVNRETKDAVRRFSHLTRRTSQKVIPRAYETTHGESKMIYLYMRDRIRRDYMITLRKKGAKDEI